MSNKQWNNLDPLDRMIRRGMHMGNEENGTYLTISFIHGFELFNTRPYHNYETWSQGYRIEDTKHNIKVEMEDLDDALKTWAECVETVRRGEALPVWRQLRRTRSVSTSDGAPTVSNGGVPADTGSRASG